MRVMRKVFVVLVVMSLAGVCLAQQQGRARGPRGQRGGRGMRGGMYFNSTTRSLWEDIQILDRIVPLKLTDAQLGSILEVYTKIPVQLNADDTKLMAIRQHMIEQGTPLTAADRQTIRQMFGRGRNRGGNQQSAAQPVTLSPQGQAIWILLTPAQQGELLGVRRGPTANEQRASHAEVLQFLTRLNTIVSQTDDPGWPAKRQSLAQAMASTTGTAGSTERKNKETMCSDYLDRMRQLPAGGFDKQREQLASGLEAMIPDTSSLPLILAKIDPLILVRTMDMTFLNAKTPGLLKEIQTARQKAANK